MSDPSMNHDEAFAQIGALALGALDADEARAVMLHVDTCAICMAELVAMREVAASMPGVPSGGTLSVERSRAIRDSLVQRAGRKINSAPHENSWRILSLAAALGLVALGSAYYREYTRNASLAESVAVRTAVADSLGLLVREKDAQLASITGPAVSVVELASSGIRAPSARMFWDRATNQWTMYAHGLSPLKPGRAYELWLVTGETKIPAGTFKPRPDGSATFTATYALEPSQLKAIAITEEPEAGVPAPTGPIILLGSATGT